MENQRQIYLLKTLELSHDPFASPVAEQEINKGDKNQRPYFFSYFVDNSGCEKPIWQTLREQRNGFIFGEPGLGKTTLRLILADEYRATDDRTLVVTYNLGDEISTPYTLDDHRKKITVELAIDFFIQIIERLDEMESFPTEKQISALQRQLSLIWHSTTIRYVIRHLMPRVTSSTPYGIASVWRFLNRPPVRYITPSNRIKRILQYCSDDAIEVIKPAATPQALMAEGLAAAKLWGFDRVAVLVDGVDAHFRSVQQMYNLIKPLLENISLWQRKHLFFYFFLPQELEPQLPPKKQNQTLTYPPFYYTIKWNSNTLAQLIKQRFKAAGSRLYGFNDIAAPEWNGQLEQKIITAANGSPSKLLEVASALIDAHASRAPERLLLTGDDWDAMEEYIAPFSTLEPDTPLPMPSHYPP